MNVVSMASKQRSVQRAERGLFEGMRKLRLPQRCGDCGATFMGGRWTWAPCPQGAPEGQCPACHRIAGHSPAGELSLSGEFFRNSRAEIFSLICNVERDEKPEHPLERIMAMEETRDGARVTTTGVLLARRIGEALSRSFEGSLRMTYGEGDRNVKVRWER